MSESYNQNHPELITGEQFCTNTTRETLRENPQWYSPPFRVGNVAYDIHGKVIPQMVPVFKRKRNEK